MVGYVRWEEKRKRLTLRRCPLGDGEVCLLEGGGRLNRWVQSRVRQAAQAMADAGVRYAAAPPEWAALLLPLRLPAPAALRRAMLGQLVDCACRQLGLCRSQASVVLRASRPDGAVTEAAEVLARRVRYLSPQLGGEAGFGLEYMSIDKVELLAGFISPEPRTLSITAPADATVTVNGITVSENYLSSEPVDASYLPELEPEATELLCRYDISGIYGTVEIGATSASGEVLEAESSDENGAVFALGEGELSVKICAPEGSSVSVNGVELDESYKTGEKLTAAFLEGLEDYGTAPELEVWGVSGLHLEPEISAEGEGGAELGAPIAQDGATVYLPASDEELESAQAGYSETFFGLYAAFESNLNDKIDTNYYNMLSYLYGSLPLATRLASEYSARTPAGGVTDTDYDKYELGSFQYYGDNCYGCNVSLYEGGKQTGGCVIIFTRINAKWYPAEVWEYSF